MAVDNFNLPSDGTEAINTLLAEEANRIGSDIHKQTLHTSPWLDLIKQSAFPDEMGYTLTSLVYDRALPTTTGDGTTVGANWTNVAASAVNGSSDFDTSNGLGDQAIVGAAVDFQGGRGYGDNDKRSYVKFTKKLNQYNLKKAAIESPRISLDDLRFAAQRQSQLSAIVDSMAETTRFTWETRNRDEYERLAGNLVSCLTASSAFSTFEDVSDGTSFSGSNLSSFDIKNDLITSGSIVDYTPTANISNAVMDKAYYQLIRKGAGTNAYGRENGRPVFSLVCSSEASYQLMTEAGFRDDVRYNNAKVSDLIAPLGIEKSFRGFYHLIDDTVPRFTLTGDVTLVQKLPYDISAAGVVTDSTDYEDADYEAAYIIHPDVMESQIPNPLSGAGSIKFDPVSYKGDFKWTNIPHAANNPDGTIGFFRGVLASASKPIKTNFGYVILFKRTSTTPAA